MKIRPFPFAFLKSVIVLCFFLLGASHAKAKEAITLLVGAMPDEIKLFQDALTDKKLGKFGNISWIQGKIGGLPVVLSQTGAGKTNAGMVLGFLINQFKPVRMVMCGSAARVQEKYSPGDIFIISEADFHDWGDLKEEGMVQGTSIWGLIEPAPHGPFHPDQRLLSQAQKAAASYKPNKKIVVDGKTYLTTIHLKSKIVTGDLFSVNQWKKNEIRNKFNADIFDMETASVALVSLHTGVPWIAIRGGSDLIQSGDASDDYLKYGPIAKEQAALFTLHFLKALTAEK